MKGDYEVTKIKAAMCAVFALAASNAQCATSLWESYPGFQAPGHAGILIGDFDGDGRSEAAISGYSASVNSTNGMRLLAVLAADSSGALDVKTISSLPMQSFSGMFRPAPREGMADRIVAVLNSGNGATTQIAILGGVPLRVLHTIPAPNIYSVAGVADVDADGQLEVVALSGSEWSEKFPVILDYSTGAVQWVGDAAASDVGIAQLDADPSLELVIAGTPGRIIDGASHQVEWSWPSGFGESILVGRFAADPATMTFAISRRWSGYVQVFRAQPYSPISEFPVEEVGAIAVVPMGALDQIAVGGGQWGNIKVHDPRTGSVVFSAANTGYGFYAIAGGDFDGNAGVELVYGSSDVLRVLDLGTEQEKYSRFAEVGPHSPLARGDFAGGGSDQVVYLAANASGSIYSASTLRIVDAASGRTLRSRENVVGSWSGGISRLAKAQLDADQQQEIILAFTVMQTPTIAVIDGVTLAEQWRRDGFSLSSAMISSLELMDVNADGVSDIVLALSTGRIHVLNGLNGVSIWQSVTILGNIAPSIAVFTTASGAPRIVMGRGEGLYVFDPVNGLAITAVKTSSTITAIHRWGTGDACEVGALDQQGMLTVYTCADLGFKRQLQTPVGTRFFRPFDAHATRFIAAAGHLLYEVQAGRAPAIVSGVLGDEAGSGNLGSVIPNPDGKSADVVIGSMHMVTRLRVESDGLFAHGFE